MGSRATTGLPRNCEQAMPMPASQLNIRRIRRSARTSRRRSHVPHLGANSAGGLHRAETTAGTAPAAFPKNAGDLLVKDAEGFWAGFVPGIKDGDLYRFYVVGTGSEGFKRDPYARELEFNGYPDCNCIVRDPARYPWHDAGFRPPAFNDLIIYQFHIGVVLRARIRRGNDIRPHRVCKILDVVERIEYFADLGVNAIMPLPFQEYQGENSLGYNGTDLFSPEMDYAVRGGGACAVSGAREPAAGREGIRAAHRGSTHRADQPVQGVHRPLPPLWDRGDRGRGLQPRRRRLRRSKHLVLRPAAATRRTTTASISPTRITPAAVSSRSGNRRCASS